MAAEQFGLILLFPDGYGDNPAKTEKFPK